METGWISPYAAIMRWGHGAALAAFVAAFAACGSPPMPAAGKHVVVVDEAREGSKRDCAKDCAAALRPGQRVVACHSAALHTSVRERYQISGYSGIDCAIE